MGNLHRGRGATAWGCEEEGGDKGRRGQTHEESGSKPGAEKMGATKAGGGKLKKTAVSGIVNKKIRDHDFVLLCFSHVQDWLHHGLIPDGLFQH